MNASYVRGAIMRVIIDHDLPLRIEGAEVGADEKTATITVHVPWWKDEDPNVIEAISVLALEWIGLHFNLVIDTKERTNHDG